jgi:hypothetical protein
MLPVLGIVATLAIVVGFAFILGRTVPSIPNKVSRFMFLFLLFIPLDRVINYVNVWAFGYHEGGGWTWTLIIALVAATYATFLPPRPHNSDTP